MVLVLDGLHAIGEGAAHIIAVALHDGVNVDVVSRPKCATA
jgi:hypothetical protein